MALVYYLCLSPGLYSACVSFFCFVCSITDAVAWILKSFMYKSAAVVGSNFRVCLKKVLKSTNKKVTSNRFF